MFVSDLKFQVQIRKIDGEKVGQFIFPLQSIVH